MPAATRRCSVIGLGLIGGSVAGALATRGWVTSGIDCDRDVERTALERNLIASVGLDPHAELVVVATPVAEIPKLVREALDSTSAIVTDVGSVKAPIAASVSHPRFVAGHPMAGSEQDGIAGADAQLFSGAVWVLTPDDTTSDASLARVAAIVTELGAEVVTLEPTVHDAVVAVVSHVPHLTAAALMGLAAERSVEHAVLLRLAAGGFRDMTRVAAGRPGIWPDICADNRPAIVGVLDELIVRLGELRAAVVDDRRDELLGHLERARDARLNLPPRVRDASDLVELRIPIPDRPGELASITRLATDLDVNIHDIELAHSNEGAAGVLIVVVSRAPGSRLGAALADQGYRPASRELS